MNAIFSKIWGWIAGAAALIMAAAGLYLRGRSTGRADERQERAEKIAQQQARAQQTKQEVNDEVAQMDDSTLRDRASRWVRNK
jgi:HAMP domain-containing protein